MSAERPPHEQPRRLRLLSSSRRCTDRRGGFSDTFARIEEALGMPARTLKMGIMDEERRTTLNLKESHPRGQDRVVFINTGFPRPHRRRDPHFHGSRPGDPQGDMKAAPWIQAYENSNVDIGLLCGSAGRARSARGCGPCRI
jgi:malate synthase